MIFDIIDLNLIPINFCLLAQTTFLYISFVILVLIAGMIPLQQYYLSKNENKWVGLIWPITLFSISLAVFCWVLGYMFDPWTTIVDWDGNTEMIFVPIDWNAAFVKAFYAFLLFNIPTVVSLAIYGGCKWSIRNKQRALKEMSVHDLE